MTKKRIFFGILFLLLAIIIRQVYVFGFSSNDNLQSIYLVPKDAVYVLETNKPIDSWKEISDSHIWKHLQQNDYFKNLTENLNSLDTIFKQKKGFFDFIGNREILISAHIYKPKKYGLFYVVDLQKIAKLNILKNNINKLINNSYKVNKRKYHKHEIIEIYDIKKRKTLSIAFIKNQLIASYTHSLVEASIDQYNEPVIGRDFNFKEVYEKVGTSDLFRIYVQYDYIDEYANVFLNKPNENIIKLSDNLLFSGFDLDLDKNKIQAKGYTNVNEKTSIYLQALRKSGKGKRTIAKIAPITTSFYLSFAFDSFNKFYENFEIIQKSNTERYHTFIDKKETVENFLKIDFKDHFFKWIDNEMALIHFESKLSKSNTDLAFILTAKDIKEAKENLEFIQHQIKKRTPVKFKQINYKEHEIHFLDVKEFFKIILGDLFKDIEKPYYTIIDKFVVFSNSPNTLKQIINNYTEKQTLNSTEEFKTFNANFDSNSSVFAYINTPIMHNSLYANSNNETKLSLKKNKDYIICFSQIGFQLTPKKHIFESNLIVNYQDTAILKTKEIFKSIKNQELKTNKQIKNEDTNVTLKNIFNISEIYPTDLTKKEFITYYKSGKKHQFVKLKNGQKNGDFKEYFENGKIKISGRYRKDKQVGVWKAYAENGELILRKRF